MGKSRIVPNRGRGNEAGKGSEILLAKIAFQMASHARANIQANGQIDTSFMVNSVYVVIDRGSSTYGGVRSSGFLQNRAGRRVYRQVAPSHPAKKNGAVVAVGANYAYWQERRKSFLRKAALQTSKDFGRMRIK